MTNKEKYIKFCLDNLDIPIFSQPWWLDAVCGNNGWDVNIFEKGGVIYASMPYIVPYRKYGLLYSDMPILTQTLGPYMKYPYGQKYVKKLSFEKEVLTELIKGIPKNDYFMQQWNFNITNWLPFYWNGYEQTTRYTYIINFDNEINIDTIYANFESNIKRNIKKAEKNLKLCIGESIENVFYLENKTFQRQGMRNPHNLSLLKRIDEAARKNANVLSLGAYDIFDNIHAIVYIIFNEEEAYYLVGGADPKYRNSGAQSWLLYNAIKFLIGRTKIFNFEGSMLKGVEKFFHGFGARQVPYFVISRKSRKARILYGLKNLARDIIKG